MRLWVSGYSAPRFDEIPREYASVASRPASSSHGRDDGWKVIDKGRPLLVRARLQTGHDRSKRPRQRFLMLTMYAYVYPESA